MQRGQALYTALEHEAMHQETLLYMWHRLPYEQKCAGPAGSSADAARGVTLVRLVSGPAIPAGTATLGADRDRYRSAGITNSTSIASRFQPSTST